MFKVTLCWDGIKYSESYHHYGSAVRAFEAFIRMSRKSKSYGQITDYHVELVQED